MYPLKRFQKASIFIVHILFIPFAPLMAFGAMDLEVISMLVNNCYSNTQSCNKSLLQINNYQNDAAINKKFSCQTRLLGLEANLIMAMSSNIKRKEAQTIIQSLKKYC
tara:strand:- start:774 stop:1097 length:324 start_codon:yes stop_codon:yes gene_type:complete